MSCWKLSAGDHSKKEYYDSRSSRKWSLSALHVEDDWKVASAMYLENRDDFKGLTGKKGQ